MVETSLELSVHEARQIALRAQGLGLPRPRGEPTLRNVRAVVSALGAVQIDAVNVLTRAHYLTVYSRLGPYPRGCSTTWSTGGDRHSSTGGTPPPSSRLSCTPRCGGVWLSTRTTSIGEPSKRGLSASAQGTWRPSRKRSPSAVRSPSVTSATRPDERRSQTNYADSTLLWYRWSDGKSALEGLFDAGRLAAAGRRGFERLYDLADRVIPRTVLSLPPPPPHDAQRALVLHAASALGVATARDLAWYFRLPAAVTRARLRELVDSGDLLPAQVQGWPDVGYLHPDGAVSPVEARALLSPFDSLLWERDRTERLFGFRHSFELYVKAPNRQYGYYVLPFLLGDTLVGRVDLKADRPGATLLVLGAYAEAAPTRAIAGELAAELRQLATWLELDAIEVSDRGDLAPHLRRSRP